MRGSITASLLTEDGQNARLGAKNSSAQYIFRLSDGTPSAVARYHRYAPRKAKIPKTRNAAMRSGPIST